MTTLSKLHDWTCTVVFNQDCGHALKRMRLKPTAPKSAFTCAPGQFVMLDLPLESFHFRRPFSILSVQPDGTFDLYYKRVGKGTQLMWDLQEGATVQVLGPLGNRFSTIENSENSILIGGGIGIAPLVCLAEENRQAGQAAGHCFYGVRSQAEVGLESELKTLFGTQYHLATDDGSAGHHGNVCDLLMTQSALVQKAEMAYVCGPTRMMEAVVQLLNQINPELAIQVSLEEHMPCGTGACTGCVVQRTTQALPSKVCVEGPVFDARSILWQSTQSEATCGEGSACPS